MLPKRTRKHIQTKMYEAMLKDTGLEFEKCQKCDYLAIIPQINGMRIFQCPECSYTFCCDCGRKCDCNHSSEKCIKLPNSLNEKFSNALIHRCYRCKLPFIKEERLFEGCNRITCKCGASQCYACRLPNCSEAACTKRHFYATAIHKIEIEKVKRSLPEYHQKLVQNTV
uniref:RING-type domain-containing protein n=1 Tax=Panagrolaimus sp. PS1159 TaxID=55785 RepID=A0AC35G728_9BILA